MDLAQAVEAYDYSQLESPPLLELSEEQLEALVDQVQAYHAIYSPYFSHEAQKTHAYTYLLGLLDPTIQRKSGENIGLTIVGPEGVRPIQSFLGQSRWSCDELLTEHRRQSGELLGDSHGVLIVDGSDFLKQGQASVGVKRQYCGEVGKKANCQAGVFVGYSSPKGYTLLDRRLYMPQEWFEAEYADKRFKTGVPRDLTFKTKNELAWAMIQDVQHASSLPVRWVTMDEAFGKDTKLLDRIDEETPYHYFAEVPSDTRLWLERPATHIPPYSGVGRRPTNLQLYPDAPASATVESLVATFADDAFALHALKDGSKGLIWAEIACCRVVTSRHALPGPAVWLMVRRNPFNHADIKYFLSNAPLDTPVDELVTVCALRWPIETMFEQAKQYLGLNEYETRSWLGWHHHMTLAILAFGFLARCALLLESHAPALTLPQIAELFAVVLPKKLFDKNAALERLAYKQRRIQVAKCSHYRVQRIKLNSFIIAAQ